MVIDCRELDRVEADPTTGIVRCGSGVTWKQFDASTQAHGLAITGGRVSSTGVTGLTIGSGSGWLERAMGLTSDRLVGARLVTAFRRHRRRRRRSRSAVDPAWRWGELRGAHRASLCRPPARPDGARGQAALSAERGTELLSVFGEVMLSAPKELCGGLAFITAPPAPWVPSELRGRVVVATITLWAGDPAEAEAGMAALDALGTPAYDGVGPMPYAEIQQIMDPGAPPGHRDYFKGGFMSSMSDAAAADIAAIGTDMRAPLTQIICAPLGWHTAYAAVEEEQSAIGHRQEEWSFQVLSLWEHAKDDAEQKTWTRSAAETMSSYSDMVSYPNFLSADDTSDISDAYSPEVFARLVRVKDRYDPDNVFRINNNIPPS